MNRTLLSLGLTAIAVTAACQSQGDGELDEQARLEALLHDEPLNQLTGSSNVARTSDPPPVDAGVPPSDGGGGVPPSDGGVPPDGPTDPGGDPGGPGMPPPIGGNLFIPPGSNPDGAWAFNDCSSARTNLFDSATGQNGAFRSVGVACADGFEGGQSVVFAAPEDLVYVPDQPSFTFEQGLTVAGWVNPTAVGGTRTLFRKRDKGTSSFALLLNRGKFELVLGFGPGRAVSVSAPARATAGVFQHVAATYDGATARLYVDGLEVNSFAITGTIPVGPGPLLIGNDGSERRLDGKLDNVFFATHAFTPEQVRQLTCSPQPLTATFSPLIIPPTAVGTPATIDIAVTNNSGPACPAAEVALFTFATSRGLTVDPSNALGEPIPGGATGHFTVTATPDDAEPGSSASFIVQLTERFTGLVAFNTFSFDVTAGDPNACVVSTSRELMITNVTVVDDPVRTAFVDGSTDPRNGVWTFKHLMEEMAPTPADAPDMVEAVMNSIRDPGTINGFSVAGRSGMSGFLAAWPRTADNKLDLARAPFRLQAIVNRFDLRNLANGDAGEGRFVFAFEQSGFALSATIIFEYKLPASTDRDVLGWANAFHGLGALSFGEDYNAALQAITERFATRGARPGRPNGSAINAVRTNEIAFSSPWELREFHLLPSTNRLAPVPVELTPDRPQFERSAALGAFINANLAAVLAERHTVPALLDGQPFQAGTILNDLTAWVIPGVDPEARHHFSVNTCNGCHASQETNVGFLQISPRSGRGSEAGLSGFLTGTTVQDVVTGQSRTFNDLRRRNNDLKAIVCADPAARALSGTTLRKGIDRVH